MVKFKLNNHRKLWERVRDSWNWVQKFGLTETKILIRRMELGDTRDIPNSCYACEYATALQEDCSSKCFKCPLEMSHCNYPDSPFYQLTYAIQEHNKPEFQRLCGLIKDCKVKEGIECE